MTIVDIYNQIKNSEPKESMKRSCCWKPIEAKDYGEIPKFNIPQKRQKTSLNKMLVSVLLFVDLVKHKRLKNKVTRMPIATNNKEYLRVLGYPKAISRLINFMTEIGLISIADSSYRFNSKNSQENKSREYYYFHVNECALLKYCETNNIFVSPKSSGSASLFDKVESKTFDPKKVRFSSKLRMRKLAGRSDKEFEDLLRVTLYNNYSGFK